MPLRDSGRFIQRFRLSSTVLSNGLKLRLTRSDSLGEMFTPKYVMLPAHKESGDVRVATSQLLGFNGRIVDFDQLIVVGARGRYQ